MSLEIKHKVFRYPTSQDLKPYIGGFLSSELFNRKMMFRLLDVIDNYIKVTLVDWDNFDEPYHLQEMSFIPDDLGLLIAIEEEIFNGELLIGQKNEL